MRLHPVFACLLGFGLSYNLALAQVSCDPIFRDKFESSSNNAHAVDDEAMTFEGAAITINVLSNDLVPQAGTCAVPQDASVTVVRPPAAGTGELMVQADESLRFVPTPGFVGTTSFEYRFETGVAFLRSNRATVTVQVRSRAPIAIDDSVLLCASQLEIRILDNDQYPWGGPNLDVASVVVTGVDTPTDSVEVLSDGAVSFSTLRAPPYQTGFSYRVANSLGQQSETASVTILCSPPFAGEQGLPPVDGLDVSQLEFLTWWRGTQVQGGTGGLVGLMHANVASLNECFFVADHTQACLGDVRSDPAAASTYTVSTGQQDFAFVVLPDGQVQVNGIEPGPVLPPDAGTTVIAPEGQAPVDLAASPPEPEVELQSLTPSGFDTFIAELIVILNFPVDSGLFLHKMRTTQAKADRRATRSRPPMPDQTGKKLIVESDDDPIELGDGEEILAMPPAVKQALGNGSEQRARLYMLPEATRHAITSRGRTVTGLATAALVGRQETQNLFTAPGQRPVPIRLGFGVAVPGSTLTPPRFDACLQPPDAPLCSYGPHPRLLAANQNGSVSVHDPEDGSLLYYLMGENAPNFTVDNGWHLIQDPNTGCLLFSDSGNEAIHRYDTNGQLLDAAFIDLGAGSVPRGMDFLEGDLLVATRNDGRIRRYRSDGSFVADQLTGTGNPNAVFTLPGGDLLVVDESGSAGTRTVRRYPANGGTPEIMVSGLGLAYQIAQDFDGHYLLAHFGLGRIEVFNFGFPQVAAPELGSNGTASRSPRGIAPLRNGKWLVSGNNGTGVAVLDPMAPESVETLVEGSSFRFIEPACLPQ